MCHPEKFSKKQITERGFPALKGRCHLWYLAPVGVFHLCKIAWICQRSEILISVALLETEEMNSPTGSNYVKLCPSSASSAVL